VSSSPAADLLCENLISLAQAARRFPPARQGRPVCAATVWRWCRRGVNVPGVGIVRLECVRLSGRWLTSVESLARFVARQTPAMEDNPPPPPRSPGRRRRASERAGEALEQEGI
jgi:hypothetical protein